MTQEKIKLNIDPSQFEGDVLAEQTKMYEETLRDFKEGSIVEGEIIEVRPNSVLVDIGYKSEGIIPKSEFKDADELTEGKKVEVLLESLEDEDGMVMLSKQQAEIQRNWERLIATSEEGGTIEGVIKSTVKGGMIVDVGVDAFLPGSQIDVIPVKDRDEYIGRKYEFKLLKINQERQNIVVSRRELLEEERKEQKKLLMQEITEGQTRAGIVKNITDFGAFIDLNGMDGLLHVTDMSWGRINHPSEVVEIGQPIEVVILNVDHEKDRISLGLKQLLPNPWDNIDQMYPVGSKIHGKVVNLKPYGAFVEIERGVEGLVHVSELSWTKRIGKASDVLSIGDMVDAVVLSIDKNEQKISLGIRQTESNPWEEVQLQNPVGSQVRGTVRNFTAYGAFVALAEGVDGMIHVSDMSWTRKINHPSEMLEIGQEVDCVIMAVDAENQRISLGMKQLQGDPWTTIADKFNVGEVIKGKVSKITAFGAFVELAEGIDGLVHISQISEDKVENVKDALSIGQEVEARIVKIDAVERKIGLSIKAARIADEEFQVSDEMLVGLRSGEELGDLAGAFDEAFGMAELEEWHPGEGSKKDKVEEPAAQES
jgi:small subunit ribosomal protein S1